MELTLEQIKLIIRERDVPFFSDEEIQQYLAINNNDSYKTVYDLLLVKAENTTTSISGLSIADSSEYFKRLARRYRPSTSHILRNE